MRRNRRMPVSPLFFQLSIGSCSGGFSGPRSIHSSRSASRSTVSSRLSSTARELRSRSTISPYRRLDTLDDGGDATEILRDWHPGLMAGIRGISEEDDDPGSTGSTR